MHEDIRIGIIVLLLFEIHCEKGDIEKMFEQNYAHQSRKDKTHTAIILAARDVFNEKGISKTYINDIALRAGVSRPSIYRHFETVYHLAVEVELLFFEEISQQFHDLPNAKEWSVKEFRQFQHNLLDKTVDNPFFIQYCIHFDQTFSNPDFPEELREQFRQRVKFVTWQFNLDEIESRVLKPDVNHEIASIILSEAVIGIIQKMMVSRQHPIWKEKYQVREIAHQMLDLLLDGLCRAE